MKKAVIAGSTLASFCVEKFGTKRIEEITEAEIQQRMQSFVELSKFELI
jgi:hypothetical protein